MECRVDHSRDLESANRSVSNAGNKLIGISRCEPGAICESCHQAAKFRFHYMFSASEGELLLCSDHFAEVLLSDRWIMAMLTKKLHEMLDRTGSPLLLP